MAAPARPEPRPPLAPSRLGWLLLAVLAVVVLGVVAGGALWYRRQTAEAWREAGETIGAVADLKLQQIVQWRGERLADMEVVRGSPNAIRGLEGFVRGGAPVRVERLQEWLATLTLRGYAHAAIVDRHERVLVQAGAGGHAGHAASRDLLARALRDGRVRFGDLHDEGPGTPIRLDLVAPLDVPDAPAGTPPFAALALEIDPAQFLYPLLASWPTPSRTAEVLLVRRDGDSVVYLNDLRHLRGTALALRAAVGDTANPGVLAALGRTGTARGTDYRGAEVLAALRQVPGSAWFLEAKMDASEFLAPLRGRARVVGLALAALVFGAGAAVAALWRQRTARHYRELYEAEVQRRALERHYESLTRYANDMIFLADGEGRIVDANERALEAYGYPREEMLALRVEELAAPDIGGHFAWTMREIEERGGGVFESVHRRRDGATFPVEVSGRLMRIDGQPYFQGIARDISERKRHERRIADLNRLYAVLSRINELIVRARDREELLQQSCRVAVESGSLALAWVGMVDGEAIRPVASAGADDGYVADLRLSLRDEPRGSGPTPRAIRENRTVTCDDLATDASMALWRSAALARGLRSFVALPLRLHGRAVGALCLYASEPRFFDEQELKLLDEVSADLSYALEGFDRDAERLRAEAERSLLVAAIEQASEIVLITDVAGVIQYVNPAFERITGYRRAEAVGRTPRILKSGRQDDDFYQGLWATVLAGGVWQGRMTNRRQDGAFYEQLTTISPVRDAAGQVVSLVAVSRDVTREAALESQLRQAQKMEELGRLAGGVAHDFNNLLTAIIGSSELVLAELPAGSPALTDVQNVQKAARRGAELTQKLLAFSRRQRLTTRAVALGETIVEFARLARRLLPEDLELVVRAESPGPAILGDPGAVDQILMNLVTNARDAVSGPGTVIVEMARMRLERADIELLGEGTPGDWVVVSVSDSGAGMTEDVRQRLFEPFFTTKEPGAGTGLGMAMVYGLVREHHGFLRVESEPGHGTTVRVYFPAAAGAAPAAGVHGEAPALPHGTETVLVVEDEESLRAFARRALERHGYTVLTAGDGLEALEVLRVQGAAAALVVTDMVMPRMGGPQLERAMREMGLTVPILFTSGYAARTVDEERLRQGGVPFLAKPWTVADLLRKVREVLDVRTAD